MKKKLNFSSERERKRDNVNISQLQFLQHGRDIVFKLSGLEVGGGGGKSEWSKTTSVKYWRSFSRGNIHICSLPKMKVHKFKSLHFENWWQSGKCFSYFIIQQKTTKVQIKNNRKIETKSIIRYKHLHSGVYVGYTTLYEYLWYKLTLIAEYIFGEVQQNSFKRIYKLI